MAVAATTIIEYMRAHDLQPALSAAVRQAVLSRADEPLVHIGRTLMGDEAARAYAELERLRQDNERLSRENAKLGAENEELKEAAANAPKPLRASGADSREAVVFQQKAPGELRGVHGMNIALWKMGALKHEPPKFNYFDPVLEEQFAMEMKELRLPLSSETHEICFEPVCRCLFVTQM